MSELKVLLEFSNGLLPSRIREVDSVRWAEAETLDGRWLPYEASVLAVAVYQAMHSRLAAAERERDEARNAAATLALQVFGTAHGRPLESDAVDCAERVLESRRASFSPVTP